LADINSSIRRECGAAVLETYTGDQTIGGVVGLDEDLICGCKLEYRDNGAEDLSWTIYAVLAASIWEVDVTDMVTAMMGILHIRRCVGENGRLDILSP
jgi:hypothetical protein